jgi:hypothetical protein
MVHLGMKLHRPDLPLLVGNPRQRIGRNRGAPKPRRQPLRLVAVAHPHLNIRRQPIEQRRGHVFNHHFRVPILAQRRRLHLAAQVMHDEVQPVADAQHRHAHRQHARIRRRRIASYTDEGPPERITPSGL